MNRMTNFRSAAIATGNVIDDSAYDNIKIVVDNIPAINNTAGTVESIQYLDANRTMLVSLYDDRSSLQRVYGSIDNVDRVYSSIDNVDTLISHVSSVDTVSSNIIEITSVSNIKDDVTTIAGISDNVSSVSDISADVSIVANNVSKVVNLDTNMSSITIISDDILKGTTDSNILNASNNASIASTKASEALVSENNASVSAALASSKAQSASLSEDIVSLAKATVLDVENRYHTLNITTGDAGSLVSYNDTTNELTVPRGVPGTNGVDGMTPEFTFSLDGSDLVVTLVSYVPSTQVIEGEW